jgi:hypothetical protein
MRSFLILLAFVLSLNLYAVEFKIEGERPEDVTVLRQSLAEALELLPESFVTALPASIKVKTKQYSGPQSMPVGVCDSTEKARFRYGEYSSHSKTLTLNKALLPELARGRAQSTQINCRHKSLYDEALATIIHELTHAYDASARVSRTRAFSVLAGFRRSFFGHSAVNEDPMRSADAYEYENVREALAVNMEYFVLDPEFQCRRPSLGAFYREHFGVDPYPARGCSPSYTVMVTNDLGIIPHKVEPSRLYRIDYLLADSGTEMASRFGHSMFRLVMCAPAHVDPVTGKWREATPWGEKCAEDNLFHLVISYRANSSGGTLDYLKGVFGGYPSMLFMLPLADVLNQYNGDELRNVISYPLLLDEDERLAFLDRTLEEHWNHRGDYKFITNNCAVESLRLLRPQVEEQRAENDIRARRMPVLTPKAMLNELVRVRLVDRNDSAIQTFASRSANLINAMKLSYGTNYSNANKASKGIIEFAMKSTSTERMATFNQKVKAEMSGEGRAALVALKASLLSSASFSVIEQQIVKTRMNALKKKFSELVADEEAMEKNQILRDFQARHPRPQTDVIGAARGGYGVPLERESISQAQLEQNFQQAAGLIQESQTLLRNLFPADISELEASANNIKEMNLRTISVRRLFKAELDAFIVLELAAWAKSSKVSDLREALQNGEALIKIRGDLHAELVTVGEVTDEKLRRFIRAALEE